MPKEKANVYVCVYTCMGVCMCGCAGGGGMKGGGGRLHGSFGRSENILPVVSCTCQARKERYFLRKVAQERTWARN